MSEPSTPKRLSDESLVGRIADEFTERLQRGERPDVEEYAGRHPRVADLLRHVLPALQAMAGETSGRAAAATPPEALTGCLGDYRLVREVGRGGMGVVYEAVQLSLNRRVALKVLPFAATLDPRQLQRFQNEAQAAAVLHHTHIVPVFGVGCDRGVPYYAMQFIEGESLAALIGELRQAAGLAGDDLPPVGTGSPAGGDFSEGLGPTQRGTVGPGSDSGTPSVRAPGADTLLAGSTLVLPGSDSDPAYFRTVARLGVQAAEALQHAHQQGVVHRDVKPANLLLDVRGHLWVTDFGLARLHNGEAGLTMTGDLLGTLRYMSPEQALGRGLDVDHRTDVYSLGVTLYELLTLRPAIPGRFRAEVLRRVTVEEPRPPRRVNRKVPAELETIVLKAMAKAPEERYATAQELADDLQRFLDDRPIRARRPTWLQRAAKFARRHRAVLYAVTAVALGALTACALLEWRANRATQAAYRAEAAERQRAEDNLRLAIRALDKVYFQSMARSFFHDPQREQEDEPLLQDALEAYERFAQRNCCNPEIRAEIATAYARVGDISYHLNRMGRAEEAYRQAIGKLDQLTVEHPGESRYRLDLARCLDHLGKVLEANHQSRHAQECHRRSLPLLKQLVAEQPDDRERRQALAFCYHNLGVSFATVGLSAEAEEVYRQALAIQERLCTEVPQDPQYQHDLAGIRCNLALLLWRGGRLADADAAFKQAREGLEKLTARYHDPWYRLRLAQTLDRMGGFYRERGSSHEAEEAYRQAVNLTCALANEYQNVPLYQLDLASGRDHLASVLTATGQLEEAEEAHTEAIAALGEFVDKHPNVPAGRESLSDAENNYAANLLVRRGQFGKAEACFRRARDLRTDLAREFPNVPDHRDRAAGACINLGAVLRVRGRYPEAEKVLRQAVELSTELVLNFKDVTDYRQRLGTSHISLGLVREAAGDLPRAEESLRQGIGYEEELARQFPRIPEYRDWAGRAQADLAALLARTGRAQEGAACELEALRSFEQLAEEFPTVADYREQAAVLGDRRGATLQAAGRLKDAEKAYRRALEQAEGLAEEFSDQAEYRRLQAGCQCHLADLLRETGRYDEAREAFREALHLDGARAEAYQGLAWLLATWPDPCRRNPGRAVPLALQAVKLAPKSARCLGTLGVVLCRAGNWQAGRAALDKAQALQPDGDGARLFFLAMACWQTGEGDEAVHWYDAASRWLAEHRPRDQELQRIRAEAGDLLGLPGAPPSKGAPPP
jgi:serine/threonine protein kinase/Tfp pilus assembly protein PilF